MKPRHWARKSLSTVPCPCGDPTHELPVWWYDKRDNRHGWKVLAGRCPKRKRDMKAMWS